MSVAALAHGVAAALRSPRWLAEARLRTLMEGGGAPAGAPPTPSAPSGSLALELRAAARALHLLARLPGLPWRYTCLYRSVTELLVLRRHAVPARLRIGVRRDTEQGGVLAHAWVVRDGAEAADAEAARYLPLENVGR